MVVERISAKPSNLDNASSLSEGNRSRAQRKESPNQGESCVLPCTTSLLHAASASVPPPPTPPRRPHLIIPPAHSLLVPPVWVLSDTDTFLLAVVAWPNYSVRPPNTPHLAPLRLHSIERLKWEHNPRDHWVAASSSAAAAARGILLPRELPSRTNQTCP